MKRISKILVFLSIFAFIFACQSEKEVAPQPDSAINQNLSKDLGGELAGVIVYAPYWYDGSDGGYTGGYGGGDFSGSGDASNGSTNGYSGTDSNISTGDPVAKTRALARNVPADYKQLNKCIEFSNDLKGKMQANGIHGAILVLKTNIPNQNIYSDLQQTNIATNGFHQAVLVESTVFDNMSPAGIDYNAWKSNLHSPSNYTITPTGF